jgi:hypothetical protein
MKTKELILLSYLALGLVAGCNFPERTIKPNINNEFPTTVRLQLTNQANPLEVQTATWEQLLDANGVPFAPDVSQAHLSLKKNSVYSATIIILDKTKDPVDDITQEIKDRSNVHLLFYQPLPATGSLVIPFTAGDQYPDPIPTPLPPGNPLNLIVTITDQDTNHPPLPVGLETLFTTKDAGTGWLQIVLRHQPESKNGTYPPGSTDVDVGFTIAIQ